MMNESAQHLRSAKRKRKALHCVIEAARFLVRGPPTTVIAKSGHKRHQARPDRNTTTRKRRTGANPAVQEPWGSTADSKHVWQRSPDGRREDKPDHTTRPGPALRAQARRGVYKSSITVAQQPIARTRGPTSLPAAPVVTTSSEQNEAAAAMGSRAVVAL